MLHLSLPALSPPFLLLRSLAPLLLLAASVQIPLLLRGRGGVVVGEGAGERTGVSLSTVLLSPPSATLVSSEWVCVCDCVLVSRLLVAAVSVALPVLLPCLLPPSTMQCHCLNTHIGLWWKHLTKSLSFFFLLRKLYLSFLKWLCWQESFYPRNIRVRILNKSRGSLVPNSAPFNPQHCMYIVLII